MAQLAIKGHATRGREVIELLEMLGGNNAFCLNGNNPHAVYYISGKSKNFTIQYAVEKFCDCIIFALEEFLKKFPYKVGDKAMLVRSKNTYIISQMIWNGNEVVYALLFNGNNTCWFSVNDLQPYKEETMEGKLISNEIMSLKIDTSQMGKRQIIFSADAPDETELVLADNFEIKFEDGKTYVVKKKLQYPKTYKECCEVLGIGFYFEPEIINATAEECSEIRIFMRLKRCRNAYWKIAGEQMGLSEPWKPYWKDCTKPKYTIHLHSDGHIFWQDVSHTEYRWLSFPTIEMRDAFYENFNKEIEFCKELL